MIPTPVPKTILTTVSPDLTPSLRRLGQSVLLSEEEIEFFEGMQNNRAKYAKGESLAEVGKELSCAFAIIEGWAISYKITIEGRRQIVAVYLPGDFIGLHLNFVRKSIVNIDALTPVTCAMIEPMRIVEIHQRFPVLASGLDWSSARNENILTEHNVSLGARSAEARLLHLYLELWCRLMLVAEAGANGFEMKLTQAQIGEVSGLSLVHTNKTLKSLTRKGLLALDKTQVSFPNLREAFKLADFDATFLQTFRTAAIATTGDNKIDSAIEELADLTGDLRNEAGAV